MNNNSQSQLIISKYLNEQLLQKLFTQYLPTRYIYYSCWQNTKNIQNSITNIYQVKYDLQSSNLQQINDIILKPTNFKIRQTKPQKQFKNTKFNYKQLSQTDTNKQNNVISNHKLHPKNVNSASFHQFTTTTPNNAISLNSQPQKLQQQQKQLQIQQQLNKLRQQKTTEKKNQIHPQRLHKNHLNSLQSPQPNKWLPLIIDKNDHILHKYKKLSPKIIPHFIDLIPKICSNQKKLLKNNSKPKIISNNFINKKQSVNQIPFKQMIANEKQEKSGNCVFNKIQKNQNKKQIKSNLLSNNQNLSSQPQKLQIQQFKLLNHRFQPSKIPSGSLKKIKNSQFMSFEKNKINPSESNTNKQSTHKPQPSKSQRPFLSPPSSHPPSPSSKAPPIQNLLSPYL